MLGRDVKSESFYMLIFGEGFGFFSLLNLVNSAVSKCFSLNSGTDLFLHDVHFKRDLNTF